MSLSDSRPQPPSGYVFPHGVPLPLCRVSQVPQLIFPRALSPTTPESPAAACAHFFTADCRLPHLWKTGHPHLRHEAEPGSLALRLTCSPHEASPAGLLLLTLAWLIVERAINNVYTFQYTRSARLVLAHQRRQYVLSPPSTSPELLAEGLIPDFVS